MAWKPTRQLLIEFPDHPPEAADAVQDDRTGPDPGTAGTARAAEGPKAAASDDERLRGGAEAEAQRVDGRTPPEPAGGRDQPGFERGDGAGAGGPSGRHAERILNGRGRIPGG